MTAVMPKAMCRTTDPRPRRGDWLQLASGGRWWPLSPRVEDVVWRDIAESLGKLNRFAGHTQTAPYSVAQHCCHVASLLPPELRLYGLLHDAHEAVLGMDWPAPLKRSAPAAVRDWLAVMTYHNDVTLWTAAGLVQPTEREEAAIRHADLVALATERRDLLATCEAPWTWDLPDPDTRDTLRPLPWHDAADRWLAQLRRLLPTGAPVQA